MPRINSTQVEVKPSSPINADKWLITHIRAEISYEGDDPTGTALTTLIPDGAGGYVKTEKFLVGYVALLGDKVVLRDEILITGDDLVALMTRNPGARDVMKLAGYDVLEFSGAAPASSVVS